MCFAHGAKINNKCVGTFGDVAAWSFCNDKIISTGGEGGMVTTKSAKLYNFINSYKDQGKNFKKYFSKTIIINLGIYMNQWDPIID